MTREQEMALDAARPAVPHSVVEDLTSAIRHALLEGDEPIETHAVRAAIACCQDADRRRELRAFVRRLDSLTSAERESFAEALHPVQVPSKLWLVDELARVCDLPSSTLVVLGAWYGILPVVLEWRLEAPRRVICVDLDESIFPVAESVVGSLYERTEFLCADAMTLNYVEFARDPSLVLVNTICEHLPDLAGWWDRVPPGQLTVLQSNNWSGCPDHVNAVGSLEELKAQTPLATVLVEGVLRLPQLDRFMLIGYR